MGHHVYGVYILYAHDTYPSIPCGDNILVRERGRAYVEEHFLLPDRIADYLIAKDMTVNGAGDKKMPAECLLSFHPRFKLSKRLN